MSQRKSSMSAESLAIVVYLRKHGSASKSDLRKLLPNQQPLQINQRLNNLRIGGWVEFNEVKGVWEFCPVVDDLFPTLRAPKRSSSDSASSKPAPREGLNFVPPRTFNFHGSTYVPPSFAPTRPGALDFSSVASHGQRC